MAAYMQITGRLAGLMAGEASGGNDPEENAELHRILDEQPVADRDQMMRVAGLTQMAFLRQDPAAQAILPAAVRAKLVRHADAWKLAAMLAASGIQAGGTRSARPGM
ncbi:MAG: hypothetical protein R3F24_10455 [Gammaproteobacteria bacterium]